MTMPSSIHRKFHGQISYTCNRFVCAANLSRVACKAQRSASSQRSRQPVLVYFTEEDKPVEAFSGESFTQVAERAGVSIPLGCNQGNCGVCEVEVEKFSLEAGSDHGLKELKGSGRSVVRACIAKLPPGYERIDISQMPDDQIWGIDGFDT